jgi:hypothetical protein
MTNSAASANAIAATTICTIKSTIYASLRLTTTTVMIWYIDYPSSSVTACQRNGWFVVERETGPTPPAKQNRQAEAECRTAK